MPIRVSQKGQLSILSHFGSILIGAQSCLIPKYPIYQCNSKSLKMPLRKRPFGTLQAYPIAPCDAMYKLNATGCLDCKRTVPGPVNLQTSPSPEVRPEMMPPLATRSITYLQFQATRWLLSIMYLSPSCNCIQSYQQRYVVRKRVTRMARCKLEAVAKRWRWNNVHLCG